MSEVDEILYPPPSPFDMEPPDDEPPPFEVDAAPGEEQDAAGERLFDFTPGGAFILDGPEQDAPIWGRGSGVLWAAGEALLIAGPQGTFKSTLGQNLALARCGFPEFRDVLGVPVAPGERRTLYMAMDRPRQIRRSLRRMVGSAWRGELDDRLAVWQGPPPMPITAHPSLLAEMAVAAGADTVIVDSLKDAARKLTDDEEGAAWNRARQLTLVRSVQVIEIHHTRKLPQGGGDRRTIDDIYGSTWITSGCGSVLLLDGAPGDPLIRVWQVKAPEDEEGPLTMTADPTTGLVDVWDAADLADLAAKAGELTALDAAKALFETETPTRAQKEKARRKLAALTRQGLLVQLLDGDRAGRSGAVWGPAK